MTYGEAGGQAVHRWSDESEEFWEVPVQHASAAFDRAVAGFDPAPLETAVAELADRRQRRSPSGA